MCAGHKVSQSKAWAGDAGCEGGCGSPGGPLRAASHTLAFVQRVPSQSREKQGPATVRSQALPVGDTPLQLAECFLLG